jgi:transposase
VARFRLSEWVPRHNRYRRLAELIDWSFLYAETWGLYSHTGQPSLDPVVFFNLVLVGRLENLVSDRRLVEHCALRLDILLFLGYEVDEPLLNTFASLLRGPENSVFGTSILDSNSNGSIFNGNHQSVGGGSA